MRELYSSFPTSLWTYCWRQQSISLPLNLCSKAILRSWRESKDELASLAMIWPWLVVPYIVSKDGRGLERLTWPNYCSMHIWSFSLYKFPPVLQIYTDRLPWGSCSPSILSHSSAVGFIYWMIWFSNHLKRPLQRRKQFIVEVVITVIWYASFAFNLGRWLLYAVLELILSGDPLAYYTDI